MKNLHKANGHNDTHPSGKLKCHSSYRSKKNNKGGG